MVEPCHKLRKGEFRRVVPTIQPAVYAAFPDVGYCECIPARVRGAGPTRVSPDSMHYLDIAQVIADEHVIGTYHLRVDSRSIPDRVLFWPPGYPAAIAAVMQLGVSREKAAKLTNTVSLLVCLLLVTSVLRSCCSIAVTAAGLLYMLRYSQSGVYLWSEPLFTMLVVAACLTLASAHRRGMGHVGLGIAAGVLASLAFAVRYTGVFVLPAFACLWLGSFALRRHCGTLGIDPDFCGRIRRAALLAILANVGGIAALLLYNWYAGGSPLGPPRAASDANLYGVLEEVLRSVSWQGWAIVPALVAWAAGRGEPGDAKSPNENQEARVGTAVLFAALLVGWALWHGVGVAAQRWMIKIDSIEGRLLFPTWVALLGVACIAMDRTGSRQWHRSMAVTLLALGAVTALTSFAEGRGRTADQPAPIEKWIAQATRPGDLLIGHGIWDLRYRTGRVVVESGAAREGAHTEDGAKVAAFLRRHGARFGAWYLVVDVSAAERYRHSYEEAGLTLSLAFQDPTEGKAVYQVKIEQR